MYQLEGAYKLFCTIKQRIEKFYAMEFCNTNASSKNVVLQFPFDVPASMEKKFSGIGDHDDKESTYQPTFWKHVHYDSHKAN